MALRHFRWNGKERTVAIDRHDKSYIALRFVDREIITMLEAASFAIDVRGANGKGLTGTQKEILSAIEESVGSING